MDDPYRTITLTMPQTPPGVPFWAVVGVWFYPRSLGSDYQWYRRATGGRWSYHHYRRFVSEPWSSGWRMVPHCPSEGPRDVYWKTDYVNWSCHGSKCHCEVW